MTAWAQTIIVPAETRGWGENKRTLPALQARVELVVDLDKIIKHFGAKAARSKGGRSSALGGRVKIKILKRTELLGPAT